MDIHKLVRRLFYELIIVVDREKFVTEHYTKLGTYVNLSLCMIYTDTNSGCLGLDCTSAKLEKVYSSALCARVMGMKFVKPLES